MSICKASVLVVDDDSPLRLSLSMVLTSVGYKVRSAMDGFAALAQMRLEVPDVLISDLNMPGMDGFELLKVVRGRFPSVRVIAMSGKFAGEDMPAGVVADTFHGKGSSLPALLKQVAAMVQADGLVLHPAYVSEPIILRVARLVECATPDLTCLECMRPASYPSAMTGSDLPGMACVHCAAKLS
jgi:CheY-like chemotaxis protein